MTLSSKSHNPLWTSLTVTAIYVLATVVVTYPVTSKFSSAVAGFEGRDSLHFLWAMWWSAKALLDLHINPANLSFLFYPIGGYHPVMAATPYLGAVALPWQVAFNPTLAFNVQFFLAPVLSGLSAYLLCLQLTHHRRAAVVAGLIFAFAPSRMGHATGCQLGHITDYWLPLYAIFLVRLFRQPCLRTSLLCGLFLTLTCLVDLQHVAYGLVFLTVVLISHQWWADRRRLLNRAFLSYFALTVVMAALLAGPFLTPLMLAKLRGTLSLTPVSGPGNSADLLGFVLPSPYNPLLGHTPLAALATKFIVDPSDLQEHVAYLGFVAMLLAGWGVWQRRQATRPWLILGLATAVFSLGPMLTVSGDLISLNFGGVSTHIVMPYALLSKVPFYGLGRTPGRLNETTMLALALMAGFGAMDFSQRLRANWQQNGALGLASAVILAESVVLFPFPTGQQAVPDFYRQLADQPDRRAVLNLPNRDRLGSNLAMLYQTVHQHKIVGGYLHRYSASSTIEPQLTMFIEELTDPPFGPDIVPLPTVAERRGILQQLGIGWVSSHKPLIGAKDQAAMLASLGVSSELFRAASRSFLEEMLGQPVYEDERDAVFAVPTHEDVPAKPLLIPHWIKWYHVERPDDVSIRWMNGTGILHLYHPMGGQGSLRFTVSPYLWPRTLHVAVNGQVVERFGVPAQQTYTTGTFPLNKGLNEVSFGVPAGCDRAVDLSAGSEGVPRCLSLRFSDIEFVPGGAPLVRHPVAATLGGLAEFLGYDADLDAMRPGDTVLLTLYWRTIQHMKKDYTIFLHLVDSQGRTVAQGDHQPLDGAYPTPRWPTGGVVGYQTRLRIPSDLPPGAYQLKLGMYLLATLERLEVTGDDSGEHAVLLGEITIR